MIPCQGFQTWAPAGRCGSGVAILMKQYSSQARGKGSLPQRASHRPVCLGRCPKQRSNQLPERDGLRACLLRAYPASRHLVLREVLKVGSHWAGVSELLADTWGLAARPPMQKELVILGPVLIVKVHPPRPSPTDPCHQVGQESIFSLPRGTGTPAVPPRASAVCTVEQTRPQSRPASLQSA